MFFFIIEKDAFTIPIIKDETTNNWYNGNDVSHTDVDCLSSDYCPEAEYSDKDANESDDEDVNESEDVRRRNLSFAINFQKLI